MNPINPSKKRNDPVIEPENSRRGIKKAKRKHDWTLVNKAGETIVPMSFVLRFISAYGSLSAYENKGDGVIRRW